MSFTEFLYVDERRLSSYFEQISSPITYDKVPVWKASLNLAGPNAEGQQARFARSFTQHEKIERISEYVKNNKAAQEVLISETCTVIPVVIPPKMLNSEFKGLKLWIASPTRDDCSINSLCLLADNRKDDDDRGPFECSGFSALTIFLDDMHEQLNESVLKENLPQGIGSVREFESYTGIEFHKSPLAFLGQLGAQIYPKRNIQSLYRQRVKAGEYVSFYENPPKRKPKTQGDNNSETIEEPDYTVTIGYPIWITEAQIS